MTPTYEVLASDVKAARNEKDSEMSKRIKAEEQTHTYRKDIQKLLIANTNTSTLIPVLGDMIKDRAKRRDEVGTNANMLAELMAVDAEIKQLDGRRSLEIQKQACADYIALMHYAAFSYQDKFSDRFNRCGEKLSPFPEIPPVDWWVSTTATTTNFALTNCGIKMRYTFTGGFRKTLLVALDGKKTGVSSVEFQLLGGIFHSRFYVGNFEFDKSQESDLSDKTNCMNNIDYCLEFLAQSKAKEFQ
jgi:hypothetical protein